MVLDSELTGILAGGAAGVSLLALAAVGWQRRASRLRLAQSDQLWKTRFDELRAEIAALGSPAGAGPSSTPEESAESGARKSAEAAAASAQAAVAAAEAAKALAELGTRGWVHATDFKLSLKTQPNENSSLEVWIANLGSTPARELKLSSNFLLCDEAPENPPLKPRVNNLVLGPSVSFSLAHFLRVSPADLASIAAGRKLLLTCGQAQYRDVFGVTRETRWCAAYDYNAKGFVPTSANNSAT